jgi:selenocysteine lyase/cysteine desulfurase
VVAAALPPGSEVVGYRGDFTSVLFPPLAQGHDVRLVELDQLADAIGPRTRLAAVSSVQSADGACADLDAIAAAAAEHDALLFVDITQGCSWRPIDASRFDFVACGAYKWLLSPRGTALMSVRPERLELLAPLAANWYAGDKLARAGVRGAARGDGLRLSFHLYNDDADVDRALDALDSGRVGLAG